MARAQVVTLIGIPLAACTLVTDVALLVWRYASGIPPLRREAEGARGSIVVPYIEGLLDVGERRRSVVLEASSDGGVRMLNRRTFAPTQIARMTRAAWQRRCKWASDSPRIS
jgi:hypothetical protein